MPSNNVHLLFPLFSGCLQNIMFLNCRSIANGKLVIFQEKYILQEFVLDLATALHKNYWDREAGWCELKKDVLLLSQSLAHYVDYLCTKNKLMKLHHQSALPVREISSNLHLKFIHASNDTS